MLHSVAAIVVQDNGKNIMKVSEVFDKSEIGISMLHLKMKLDLQIHIESWVMYPWPAVQYSHRCMFVNMNSEQK